MSSRKVLFAGLPITGKTTFIAALWYYVFQSHSKGDFVVNTEANEEREYLNTISLEWAGCKEVQRTSQSVIETVKISMTRKADNKQIVLSIPDISGETFRSQFKSRTWDEEFDQIVAGTGGIILFIDPMDKKNVPKLIYHNHQHYKNFGENAPIPEEQKPWSIDFVPNQVKLVDFLQMVNYRTNRKMRLSVVISCWDLVEKSVQPKLPQKWCEKELPLLYQFLNANSGVFSTKYFGVSAQGASYDNPENISRLVALDALQRVKVVEDKIEGSNEILRPILWVTDEDQN